MVHGKHILEDVKSLYEYPTLGNGSTLFLLAPLLGGAELNHPDRRGNPEIDPALPQSDEQCMITHESFEDNGTVVLSMPCGHAISPGGLVDYCWSELNANKTNIQCLLCTREWSAEVVKQYGGVSDQEFKHIEERLSKNFCIQDDGIKQCARCKSFCSRINEDNPRVVCHVCTKSLNRSYHFCWHCLREWNRNSGTKSCGYEECKDEQKLQQLKDSETVTIQEVSNIFMYRLRACPHCGEIIRCRNAKLRMKCRKCSTEFCFNCLRAKSQGSWFCGSDDKREVNKVECALAPIQKKIPRRGEGGDDNGMGGDGEGNAASYCNIL